MRCDQCGGEQSGTLWVKAGRDRRGRQLYCCYACGRRCKVSLGCAEVRSTMAQLYETRSARYSVRSVPESSSRRRGGTDSSASCTGAQRADVA